MLASRFIPAAARTSVNGAGALHACGFQAFRPGTPMRPRSTVMISMIANYGLSRTVKRADLLQKFFIHTSPRRPYDYDRSGSQHRQQQQTGRVFQGIPVSSRDMPPRSSFEDTGLHSRSFIFRTMRSTSMQTVVILAVVGALLFYFSHLELVPVSGRRRFNYFGEETMNMLGQIQYDQLMEEARAGNQRFLPDYDPRTLVVRHVMSRLIPVSGMSNNPGDWEIVVIDDPNTANAFVLPGGKVFVFSGIFAAARNEDAVAAVLGHELAHNLANHHGERASSAIGSTILSWSAFLLTGGLSYFVLSPVINLVFNAPMSRKQESEADFIGLMLMAEACFNPAQALNFWQRMDQEQKLQPPEWISTHPSNQHRIEKIKEWLPAAMEKRKESSCTGTQDFAERFKRALRNGIILGS